MKIFCVNYLCITFVFKLYFHSRFCEKIFLSFSKIKGKSTDKHTRVRLSNALIKKFPTVKLSAKCSLSLSPFLSLLPFLSPPPLSFFPSSPSRLKQNSPPL